MYEEDEKQSSAAASESPYDERLVVAAKRIIDQKSEDLLKAIPLQFLEHIQDSYHLTGVPNNYSIIPRILGFEHQAS